MARFEDKRGHRSDHYQYLMHEISVEDTHLNNFTNAASIDYLLNPFKYNEKLLDLQERLLTKTYELMDKNLTERQSVVIRMTIDGYTQSEIAKILNCNQSSVHKCLYGNVDYSQPKNKRYGGFYKKIKKIIKDDPEIKEILEQIAEETEEKM